MHAIMSSVAAIYASKFYDDIVRIFNLHKYCDILYKKNARDVLLTQNIGIIESLYRMSFSYTLDIG